MTNTFRNQVSTLEVEAIVQVAKELKEIRLELQKMNLLTLKNREAEINELLSPTEKKWLNSEASK